MLALTTVASLSSFLPPHAAPPQQLRRHHVRAAGARLQFDPATYNPEVAGLNPQAANVEGRTEGMHGTGYRFMPMSTCTKEASPVIVCIAGAYPGLTADQLRAPVPLPFPEAGGWNYHMLTTGAAPGGFCALPGTPLLKHSPDTVAVVCMSNSLGLEFPDGNEHEVLALIDRQDAAVLDAVHFDPKGFYAFSDPAGNVAIRWFDALPDGWSILGRVLLTQMPFVVKPGAGSGFAEGSDEFEF